MLIISSLIFCWPFTTGCKEKPWPDSPLYEPPENSPNWTPPVTAEEAKAGLEGHYAQYNIVAYIGQTPAGPMRTFIISYGFTDFTLEGNDLVETDRFCNSVNKNNQPFTAQLNDAATQAIKPRTATVDVSQEGGAWKIVRPATPTLIGINGDPWQPLSLDPNDPNINDADGDGKPGVTVHLTLYGLIKAELYIARREIFQSFLTLYSEGRLYGYVVDTSEQLVIGATLNILNMPSSPPQYEDLGLSPILLVRVADDIDTCEELMAIQDDLFPPQPVFRRAVFSQAALPADADPVN
jgi:hypothetical protein